MDTDMLEAESLQEVLCACQIIIRPLNLPRSQPLTIPTRPWYHLVHRPPSLLGLKRSVTCLPSETRPCLLCLSTSDPTPSPPCPLPLSPRTTIMAMDMDMDRIMRMRMRMRRLEDKARSQRNVLIAEHIRRTGMPICCQGQVLVRWPPVPSGTDVLLPLLPILTPTILLSLLQLPLPLLLPRHHLRRPRRPHRPDQGQRTRREQRQQG